MSRFARNVHLVLGCSFFVAIVFSVVNDWLDLGFFGRHGRLVVALIIGAFVIYGAFFMPTRQDLSEYARRRGKES